MNSVHTFPCPNCGNCAFRRHFVSQEAVCFQGQIISTECPVCDYLMSICSLDGKVIETSSYLSTAVNNPKKAMTTIVSLKQEVLA